MILAAVPLSALDTTQVVTRMQPGWLWTVEGLVAIIIASCSSGSSARSP